MFVLPARHLILQAPEVETRDLKEIAQMCFARGIERIEVPGVPGYAYRLRNVVPPAEGLGARCEQAGLDWGLVPEGLVLESFRLAVMDMDSTLISIECIDELADMAGVKPEVSAITEAAMRGELDFSASLARRVSLLAGLPEAACQRVLDERLRLNPGAERMVAGFRSAGLHTVLVSGGFTWFAEKVAERLGIAECHANVLGVADGRLTGSVEGRVVDAAAKARVLNEAREALGVAREQVLAIGDGANDLAMMAVAGASVAYRGKPAVQAQASYALNRVGLDGVLNLLAP